MQRPRVIICLGLGSLLSLIFCVGWFGVQSFKPVHGSAAIAFPATGSSVDVGSQIIGSRTLDLPIRLFLDSSTLPFYQTTAGGDTYAAVIPPTTCASHTITAQEYSDSTFTTPSGAASTITITATGACGGNLQIGNIVWKDTNNNGLNDESAAGINGVYVELYADTNANGTYDAGTDVLVTGTTTTTVGGFPGLYSMANLTNGNYFVVLPTSNFAPSGALNGMLSSTGSVSQYEPAPGPNNDVNNDDNGTMVGGPTGYATTGLLTLAAGTEPTNDGDSSSNTNFSIDFGFLAGQKIGDSVWTDTNNNGLQDDGVAGVNGVVMNLYKDTNGNGSYDQGVDSFLATTTTYSNGSFPGHYEFPNLYPGEYIVQVAASNFTGAGVLKGKFSSTGASTYNTGPYEPAPDPDNDFATDDNGTQVGGPTGYVVSQAITITAGGEPTPGFGIQNFNATLDFGFAPSLTLGNLVWNDKNNTGVSTDDFIPGINGVLLNLYKDTNGNGVFDPGGVDEFVTSTVTASNGGFPGAYQFTGLYPGDYIVQIPNSNFASDKPLYGRSSSTGAGNAYEPAADPDNNIENDDNGTLASNPNNGVVSQAITLTVGGEPSPGFGIQNFNATLDFGFYIPLKPTPDLIMSTGQIGRFQQGQLAGVSFVVSNSLSAVDATNPISLSSTLPAGVTFTSDPVIAPSWNCSKTSNQLNCTYTGTYPVTTGQILPSVEALVSLAANAPASVTVVGSTTTSNESSTNLANNSSARTVTVDPLNYLSMFNSSFLSTIPTRDGDFNALFTQNGPGWTGSDVAFSQILPDGKVAWVFGDSYIGTTDPVTRVRNGSTSFIRNSMMIQNGNSMQTLISGTVGNPSPLFINGNSNNWYWPADLYMEGGKLQVFLHEFTTSGASGDFNFAPTGVTAVATMDPTTYTVEKITPLTTGAVNWGLFVYENDADYNYIYGNEDVAGVRYIHVARAPKGQIGNFAAWQFYDGTTWQTTENDAPASRTVAASAASVINVNGGYMMTSIAAFSRTIDAYFSKTPFGPWGDKTVLYNMPELQSGNRRYAYNPIIHPEFTNSSSLLLSYDTNILGGDTNSDTYRPWFIRIKLSSLPDMTGQTASLTPSTPAVTTSPTVQAAVTDVASVAPKVLKKVRVLSPREVANALPQSWRVPVAATLITEGVGASAITTGMLYYHRIHPPLVHFLKPRFIQPRSLK